MRKMMLLTTAGLAALAFTSVTSFAAQDADSFTVARERGERPRGEGAGHPVKADDSNVMP